MEISTEAVVDAIMANLVEKDYTCGRRGNKFLLDGVTVTKANIKDLFLSSGVTVGTNYDVYSSDIKKAILAQVTKKAEIYAQGKYKESVMVDATILDSSPLELEDYQMVVDIGSARKRMVHRKTLKPSAVSAEAWMEVAEKILDDELLIPIHTRFDYDPTEDRDIYICEVDTSAIPAVNMYMRPAWTEVEIAEADYANCPQEFLDLLRFIFHTEEDVKYFLAWLSLSLRGKNTCCMVLNGGKGIGKTLLANICMRLHGLGVNASTVPPSFFADDRFNGVIDNKTLLYLDEKEIKFKQHTMLKTITNKHLMVELKGQEARQITSYCDFLISSNNITDMYILPDDRRFSVMDLTKKPDHLAIAWADAPKFVALKRIADDVSETDPLLVKLGHWLKYTCDIEETEKYMMEEPWKGNHFYRLVVESCSVWQRILVEYFQEFDTSDEDECCLSYEEYKKMLKKASSSKIVPNTETVQRFFTGFDYYGLGSIGDITADEDGDFQLEFNVELAKLIREYNVEDRQGDFIYRTDSVTPVTLGPQEDEDDGLDCL